MPGEISRSYEGPSDGKPLDPPWEQEPPPVVCPDCGLICPIPNVWDNGKAVAGTCPKCREQLYFA